MENGHAGRKETSSDFSASRSSYLRFQLPAASGTTSAKLRIYGHNHENSKSISVHAYGVSIDSWTENGINKYNAPAASTASLGYVAVNDVYKYYEIDVTSYVKAQQQSGETLVSLLLADPNNRNTRLVFNSKENGANPPQLIVQTIPVTVSNTREGAEEVITQAEDEITISRNPASEILNINLADWHKVKTIELLNSRSDVVYHSGEKPVQSVNIKELPSGIYLVRISMVDGKLSCTKYLQINNNMNNSKKDKDKGGDKNKNPKPTEKSHKMVKDTSSSDKRTIIKDKPRK